MQKKFKSAIILIATMFCLALFLSGCNAFLSAGNTNDTSAVWQQLDEIDIVPYPDSYSLIVWLDAGHGGFDVGTYVVLDECGTIVYEKDITLAIVLKVYDLFQKSDSGVRVLLSRADDSYINLHDRPPLWNCTTAEVDLVVSVHVDFYEGPTAQAVSGIQVNYYQNNVANTGRVDITNRQFAQILQDNLVYETGARDRFVRGDRGFIIPANSTMPAVLIETGFMSNNYELSKLLTEEYRMSIATAIYNGIVAAIRL